MLDAVRLITCTVCIAEYKDRGISDDTSCAVRRLNDDNEKLQIAVVG